MATIKKTSRKSKRILSPAVLVILLIPNILISQAYTSQLVELHDQAVNNYRIGLHSGNDGVMMSCLFFAGKYKMRVVAQDLLEIIQNSDDDEVCQMAIWSLYQIGEDSSCEKLKELLKTHPSKKIREYCKFLEGIREYQNSFVVND